jgi:3-oxoacyl-[acyl-carrier protein] reductase
MHRSLSIDRTFLIVGASGAIGSAVARRLASPGVTLILHYCSNRETVEQLRRDTEQAGAHARCVSSTLADAPSCEQLWAAVKSLGTRTPDGVALCAGRVPWRNWDALTEEDWKLAMFEHCIAPFILARQATAAMSLSGCGSVVYLSSIAAKYAGSARTVHYASAKSALETAMRGLARELAQLGVRVNGVRAGFVDTPQQAGRSSQEITDRVAKIPMKRAGSADEVASAITYLLSADSSFITGELMTVAGGD